MAIDPVCGMEVETERAAASAEYGGNTYYFCAESCRETFEQDPGKYASEQKEGFFKRLFR